MSETKEDGGPAFPLTVQFPDGTGRKMQGMSLRDRFAIAALQALGTSDSYANFDFDGVDHLARDCFRVADAMLKARKETQ